MCIFCKIINKEIPSYTIYEDECVFAFLDISQVTRGHVLVVPKQHYDNMLVCDEETLAHLVVVAKTLANRIMERTGAAGMNVLSNVHEVAGQSVHHFHMHLIPRYGEDDACSIQFKPSPDQDMETLQELLASTK